MEVELLFFKVNLIISFYLQEPIENIILEIWNLNF